MAKGEDMLAVFRQVCENGLGGGSSELCIGLVIVKAVASERRR